MSAIPPAFGERSPVNSGLTTKLERWTLTHLKSTFFGRPYFGHIENAASQIFTYDREWPRLANPHPTGDGGPPTIFNNEKNSEIGPKFSVCALITLGLRAETSLGRHDNLGTTFGGMYSVGLTAPGGLTFDFAPNL